MVASVFRRFAAMAAVLILSACGGGDQEAEKNLADVFARAIAQMPAGETPVSSLLQKAAKAPVAKPAISASAESSARSASVLPQSAGASASVTLTRATSTTPLAATVATSPTPDQFLDWVARTFPDFFPGEYIKVPFEGYVLRHYPLSGSFIAVGKVDGKVYAIVPALWGADVVKPLGLMDVFTCYVDAEMCRPRVVTSEVTPVHGAVNVQMRNTVIMIPFNPKYPIFCPTDSTTGTFGEYQGTLECTPTKITITVPVLPASTPITVTLKGYSSADGSAMVDFSSTFTTIPKVVRLVTVNWWGYAPEAGVSIIDPANRAVTPVPLNEEMGGSLLPWVADPDNATAEVFVGQAATNVLQRIDGLKGESKPSWILGLSKYEGTGIQGVAHNSKDVAVVTGLLGKNFSVPYLRNRLIAFDKVTGQKVFPGTDDFLGDSTMIPTKLIYSAAYGKWYVFMAKESAFHIQTTTGWNGRDAFYPGTVGTVVEIDAVTYKKERIWNVGSWPIDGEILGKILYVINAGDKSLMKIDLSAPVTTPVVTIDWRSTFVELAVPTNIMHDPEKCVYYVSDWENAVRVMDCKTDQQVGQVIIGDVPRGMGIANGSLWVAAPKQEVWNPTGRAVYEIDRDTRKVKNVVPNVGNMPGGMGVIDTERAQP